MSDSVSNTQAAVTGQASVVTTSSTASTTSTTTASPSEVDSSQSVSNMSQLKDVAPEVYNKMMQGIAINICNDMKSHQDRIKKIMRENRQQS